GLRGDTAGDHDLDLVGALPELVAYRLDHLRHAVGDAAHVGKARAAGTFNRRLIAAPEIRVSAGLTDRHAGNEKPRRIHEPALGRDLGALIATAGVAHGGKAPHQHVARVDHRLGGQQRQRHALEQREIDLGQKDVNMGVDQARHQRAAAQIDAGGVGASGANWPVGNFTESIVIDQEFDPVLQVGLARVEKLYSAVKVITHV